MTHTIRLSQFEAMKKERDELAAQLTRIRGAGERLMDTSQDSRAVAYWVEVAEETPCQSLVELKAKAVENAERYACKGFDGSGNAMLNKVLEYAEKIRRGHHD